LGAELLAKACYISDMTKLLEQALREIEQLPEGEQDAAAGALLDYLKHRLTVQLTDEQVAEVRRRRAGPDRKLVSHDEAASGSRVLRPDPDMRLNLRRSGPCRSRRHFRMDRKGQSGRSKERGQQAFQQRRIASLLSLHGPCWS